MDLLVGQNGQQSKLFHNAAARPGLRVRLVGSPQNLDAIGAVLRLGDGSHQSASREVQAGTGYWSQNSAVQVITAPFVPTELIVRWPGGKEGRTPVPPGAREVTVKQ